MEKVINIAIDGPAGAGKSTIAKLLAKKLGYTYLDTGAMYRAIGLKAYMRGIAASEVQKVEAFLPNTSVDIVYSGDTMRVLLDGKDVSTEIREHHMSKVASDISKIKAVRLKLVELQREIAAKKSVVVDGRDISSYVLPNADLKIYLTASSEIRAKRRFEELLQKGQSASFEEVLKDVIDRDYNDMNRDFAPLVQTPDAVLVDSSNLTIEGVVEKIYSLWEAI